MLTTNFYRIMLNKMQKDDLLMTVVKPDGTISTTTSSAGLCLHGLGRVLYSDFGVAGHYGIMFGTGTTPPTMNDYKLESPIIDGTVYATDQNAPTQGFETDKAKIYVSHEVKNQGTNPVTITEAGVFGCQSTASKTSFLLDRTVLDTPVTIPAGESRTITYAIVFEYPTA